MLTFFVGGSDLRRLVCGGASHENLDQAVVMKLRIDREKCDHRQSPLSWNGYQLKQRQHCER